MSDRELGQFWEKKLLSFFRKMNTEGDGRLSKGDYVRMADRYIELGNLDDVKAKQVHRKMIKIWTIFFGSDSEDDTVDEATYIKAIRNHVDLILKCCVEFFNLWFDVIDLSGEGIIQKEEFAMFLKVFGVEDESDAEKAFKVIDTNEDGQLSQDEFVDFGIEYFSSDDESLPSKFMFGPLI